MRDKGVTYPGDGPGERGDDAAAQPEHAVRGRRYRRGDLERELAARALSHVGYKARPGGANDYGRRVGYSGHDIPWSGSFVDCVFRDARIFIPSCIYSPSGLAEFSADGRLFREPAVGDVVFYGFPTVASEMFGMPHVGIVVDADGWRTDRVFKAVEGQVENSVRVMLRDATCVTGFGRPRFDVSKARPGRSPKLQTVPFVDPTRLSLSSAGRDVVNVQLALERLGLLDRYSPGVFDAPTRLAFAHWQRVSGYVGGDANGVPTPASVSSLGNISGVFTTENL